MPSVAKATINETTSTITHHPYTYFHLKLTTIPPQNPRSTSTSSTSFLDEISLRQYLTAALTQSFGITGSAVAIDILKVDGRDAWLRVQSEDADLLNLSLAQWSSAVKGVALRVCGRACWLGGLMGSGEESRLWSLET